MKPTSVSSCGRRRIGRRVALFRARAVELQRIERRHGVGELVGVVVKVVESSV